MPAGTFVPAPEGYGGSNAEATYAELTGPACNGVPAQHSSCFEADDPQRVARRLRKAQMEALRMAQAQMAAKKRLDAEIAAARMQDPQDPSGMREPPSPAAASTASAAPEEGSQGSEAEWSQSNISQHSQHTTASSTWNLTVSEASQMKAKIYEAMAALSRAREQATQNVGRQRSEAERNGSSESLPPREGAAWEAARIEVARIAAEASAERVPSSAIVDNGYSSSEATTPPQAQKQDPFSQMVALQMKAQEAMKRRVGGERSASMNVARGGQ